MPGSQAYHHLPVFFRLIIYIPALFIAIVALFPLSPSSPSSSFLFLLLVPTSSFATFQVLPRRYHSESTLRFKGKQNEIRSRRTWTVHEVKHDVERKRSITERETTSSLFLTDSDFDFSPFDFEDFDDLDDVDEDDSHLSILSSPSSSSVSRQQPGTTIAAQSLPPPLTPHFSPPGRQGYNRTILHLCHYDYVLYRSAQLRSHWEIRLSLLQTYADTHDGDVNVPINYRVDDVRDYGPDGSELGTYRVYLGRWLHGVRTAYRRSLQHSLEQVEDTESTATAIPDEYIRRLDDMGINWDGVGRGRRPAVFRRRCDEVRSFRDRFGHVNIPRDWVEDRSLGMWVVRQRMEYNKWLDGRKSVLTEERVKALRELGLVDVNSSGDANVGEGDSDGRKNKGGIATAMKGKLSVVELEDWNGTIVRFMEGVGGKEGDFEDTTMDTEMETTTEFDGGEDKNVNVRLETTNRQTYALGTIEAILEEKFERQWQESLESLKIYSQIHGHCDVPPNYRSSTIGEGKETTSDEELIRASSDASLGYWVLEQRRQYAILLLRGRVGGTLPTAAIAHAAGRNGTLPPIHSRSTLTPERLRALVDIGFDFRFPYVDENDNDDKNRPPSTRQSSVGTSIRTETGMASLLTTDNGYDFPLPWEDVGSTNVPDHHNDREGTKNKAITSKKDIDGESMARYCHSRKMKWQSRNKFSLSADENLNDNDNYDDGNRSTTKLEQIGSEFSDGSDDATTYPTIALRDEYEWWELYHDLRRYHAIHGDFRVISDGEHSNGLPLWYSESLEKWTRDQDEAYAITSEPSGKEDGTSLSLSLPEKNKMMMKEWHYRALRDIGYDFVRTKRVGSTNDGVPLGSSPRRVGRKPSVVSLELESIADGMATHEYTYEYDDLESFLREERDGVTMRLLRGAEGKENAEEIAWQVRYEEMKREDVVGNADDRLALWAANQRKQYVKYQRGEKSKLTSRRVRLLSEIGFDWETSEEDGCDDNEEDWEWNVMALELRDFKECYGHCFIPTEYFPNPKLGRWVHLQRQRYRRPRVVDGGVDTQYESSPPNSGDGRAEELARIGLDLTMDNFSFAKRSFDTLWNARFEELRRYGEKHGDCDVVLDYASPYYELALWVKEQRTLYHRATSDGIPSQLNEEKIGALESVGFIWKQPER